MEQLKLLFAEKPKRGGARPGAGRKRLAAGLRNTPHRERSPHRAYLPVHITLRSLVCSLRSEHVVGTVLGALRDSNREQFRVAHYSIQGNHLHLVVEAQCKASLSAGVRGLMVRIARRVNRLLFRRGRFWADRWHSHTLKTPREVRNALVYVLRNHEKHAEIRRSGVGESAGGAIGARIDALSSARYFDGFVDPPPLRAVGEPCVLEPRTWLLRVGWQRHGLIHATETPKVPQASKPKPLTAKSRAADTSASRSKDQRRDKPARPSLRRTDSLNGGTAPP